ncbi:uncharacterized protein LOC119231651 [Talpa occidentalis]|uniref:uncharacterized protein LOC119231651 n=1 Tax=Talpa occidentalis TaxID=50954 RepID=UPI0023FA3FA7|nr:uncharacterized protein LOC119231651 [Talpa occidentalis]
MDAGPWAGLGEKRWAVAKLRVGCLGSRVSRCVPEVAPVRGGDLGLFTDPGPQPKVARSCREVGAAGTAHSSSHLPPPTESPAAGPRGTYGQQLGARPPACRQGGRAAGVNPRLSRRELSPQDWDQLGRQLRTGVPPNAPHPGGHQVGSSSGRREMRKRATEKADTWLCKPPALAGGLPASTSPE